MGHCAGNQIHFQSESSLVDAFVLLLLVAPRVDSQLVRAVCYLLISGSLLVVKAQGQLWALELADERGQELTELVEVKRMLAAKTEEVSDGRC